MAKKRKKEIEEVNENLNEENNDPVNYEDTPEEQQVQEENNEVEIIYEDDEPQAIQENKPSNTEEDGLCLVINKNDYPIDIVLLDGDSIMLSPRQRATLARDIVDIHRLPTGVSCI